MVIIIEMESAARVQILEKAVCISLWATALQKGMNPIILPPVINK